MKQKKTFFLALAGFILFLTAAGILYGKLSSQISPEGTIAVESDPGEIQSEETGQEGTKGEPEEEGETAEDTENTEEQPPLAPDFTVMDQDENPVKLSDFRGTPVVVNFWASWCPPCKKEMPEFDQVCEEQEGKVQFLMVNLTDGSQETMETAKAYIEEQGYAFPVFYDTEQEAAYAYGVSSIPSTYFINADGVAVARAQGMIARETLLQGIDLILEAEEQ